MFDVLIKNGKIVTADYISEGNIAVKTGKLLLFWKQEWNRKRKK